MGSNTSATTTSSPGQDASRLRQLCQVVAALVNGLPAQGLLRRVLAVAFEELFAAVFRDYGYCFDPREEDASCLPPRLSEGALAMAVPYSSMVQTLRDAAKDAIMWRLELEANMAGGMVSGSAGSVQGVGKVGIDPVGSGGDYAYSEQTMMNSASVADELRLREDLRNSRLLADTYHSRLLELEKKNVQMEEEKQSWMQCEVECLKLGDEVRALRRLEHAEQAGAGASAHAGSGSQDRKAARQREARERDKPTDDEGQGNGPGSSGSGRRKNRVSSHQSSPCPVTPRAGSRYLQSLRMTTGNGGSNSTICSVGHSETIYEETKETRPTKVQKDTHHPPQRSPSSHRSSRGHRISVSDGGAVTAAARVGEGAGSASINSKAGDVAPKMADVVRSSQSHSWNGAA